MSLIKEDDYTGSRLISGSLGGGGGRKPGGKPPGGDPFISSVFILCGFDGTNGSTVFTDDSQLHNNMAVGTGAPVITTTLPKFGTACLNLNGEFVSTASVAQRVIGAQDFTVEFWYKTPNPAATYNIFDGAGATSGASAGGFVIYQIGSQLVFYRSGANQIIGGTLLTSTWQFIAADRHGSQTRLFLNGVMINKFTDNANYSSVGGISLGSPAGSNPVGTFDEFRYTVGNSRYGSDTTFTVPQTAFSRT